MESRGGETVSHMADRFGRPFVEADLLAPDRIIGFILFKKLAKHRIPTPSNDTKRHYPPLPSTSKIGHQQIQPPTTVTQRYKCQTQTVSTLDLGGA
ncbi:hypothetical protein B0T26DRAFT_722274 [Lasiosphaeria miniovina]|uniref:Uncharacterized protein n=1 Tax=Lasiosphaeria miniovina TaxID=1954250 RepID=A0AA40A5M3_9PEZI|nr:uncharacterized protein B0T26DRAFT_722274 [Lasiosphaeria miniovina]KAK0709621.1 hypothetical protein B0T26DRAFT_722274 [Lasiosphaeria miniovina]